MDETSLGNQQRAGFLTFNAATKRRRSELYMISWNFCPGPNWPGIALASSSPRPLWPAWTGRIGKSYTSADEQGVQATNQIRKWTEERAHSMPRPAPRSRTPSAEVP
jgi:hypothetical protein